MPRPKKLELDLRNPVLRAIRKTKGTAPRIAKACGVKPSAVWQWKRVPPHHAVTVSAVMDIPLHKVSKVFQPQ